MSAATGDRPVVLITAQLTPDDLAYAREQLEVSATVDYRPAHPGWERDQLIELLRGADAVIAGGDVYDEAAVSGTDRLRIIARLGVGFDLVDVDAAVRHGIYVTTTPGANAESVADLTIGMIIALVRGLVDHAGRSRDGRWTPDIRHDVADHPLGLVGLGAIGSRVARRAQAMGMDVAAYDPGLSDDLIRALGVRPTSFDDLIATSDIVSLHLPLRADTRHTMDEAAIRRMPAGAYLVNTARGGLVDEAALLSALDDGQLSGAALDVFATEPATGLSATLATHPKVLATPHIAASTSTSIHRSVALAIESVLVALDGNEPPRLLAPVDAPRS